MADLILGICEKWVDCVAFHKKTVELLDKQGFRLKVSAGKINATIRRPKIDKPIPASTPVNEIPPISTYSVEEWVLDFRFHAKINHEQMICGYNNFWVLENSEISKDELIRIANIKFLGMFRIDSKSTTKISVAALEFQ